MGTPRYENRQKYTTKNRKTEGFFPSALLPVTCFLKISQVILNIAYICACFVGLECVETVLNMSGYSVKDGEIERSETKLRDKGAERSQSQEKGSGEKGPIENNFAQGEKNSFSNKEDECEKKRRGVGE